MEWWWGWLDAEAVKSAIESQCSNSESSPWVGKCTDPPRALSYVIKPKFFQKVCYIDDIVRQKAKREQTSEQRAALVRLGQYELPHRYVLSGCRINGDRVRLDLNLGVRERLNELAMTRRDGSAYASDGEEVTRAT
jgi:hypothetical protein